MLTFQTIDEAENYVDSIARCLQKIKKAVYEERLKRAEELLKKGSSASGFNPTMAAVIAQDEADNIGVIESVKIKVDDRIVTVVLPELWIESYTKALKLFTEKYGANVALTIIHRYGKGWLIDKVYAIEGIGRRTVFDRRAKFLPLLMTVAASNDLIKYE